MALGAGRGSVAVELVMLIFHHLIQKFSFPLPACVYCMGDSETCGLRDW